MTTQHARRLIAALVVTVATAILGSLLSSPSQAATLSPTQMATDVVNHVATTSELSSCASSPTCTDLVYGTDSPEGYGTSESLAEANAELGADTYTPAAGACPSGSKSLFSARSWTRKGGVGNVVYTWHWGIWFCRNDNTNRITRWLQKKDWLTNPAWFVSWTSDQTTIMNPTDASLPALNTSGYRQRHLKLEMFTQVVPVNVYPWGKLWIYGDGVPTFARGAA